MDDYPYNLGAYTRKITTAQISVRSNRPPII